MTDDERDLLLQTARVVYIMGMGYQDRMNLSELPNDTTFVAAIRRVDPTYEPPKPVERPRRWWQI